MSSQSIGKVLTQDLVFTKTKTHGLQMIKNLNMWGNDLEDLALIQKMPNLQVVSLSVNRIRSLKYFKNCQKLQQLYLRKNNIDDIREIKYLKELPGLKVLWLHDNPCAQVKDYRQIVIKNLPHIAKLDNTVVTPEERANCQNFYFDLGPMQQESKHQQSNSIAQKKEQHYEQFPGKSMKKWDRYQQSPQSNMGVIGTLKSQEQEIQQKPKWGRRASSGTSNAFNPKYANKLSEPIQWPKVPQSQHILAEPQNRKFEKSKMQVKEQDIKRNQNILMGILSLMRQLDNGSLQIVIKEAKKLQR